jgi:hypothetical protein
MKKFFIFMIQIYHNLINYHNRKLLMMAQHFLYNIFNYYNLKIIIIVKKFTSNNSNKFLRGYTT